MTNTQKALRLIGAVWAVPAPIHAQDPWCLRPEFITPSTCRIEKEGFP
jgi:hypothetical protein